MAKSGQLTGGPMNPVMLIKNPFYAESMIGDVINKFKTDFKKRDTLFAKGVAQQKPLVNPNKTH